MPPNYQLRLEELEEVGSQANRAKQQYSKASDK